MKKLSLLGIALVLVSCAEAPKQVYKPYSQSAAEMEKSNLERIQEEQDFKLATAQRQIDDLKARMAASDARIETERAAAKAKQIEKPRMASAAAKLAEVPMPTASPNAKEIDAKVNGIMSGEHGKMPPAQKMSSNTSGVASVLVKNRTSNTLTVSYSGPTSNELVLAPAAEKSLSLAAGTYKVAASVDDPTIIPFAGKDVIGGGMYRVEFYIETTSY